ncbi:MAG: TetR-like C-terminal domain-containing protein [Oscillospiraceae bacterium]
MKKKEDRRIRITKLAIKESLLELMQVHPIAKISVKMICDSADINRSTFYAHYKDQYYLLNQLQQEAVQDIKEHIFAASFVKEEEENTVPVIVKVLKYCKSDITLFKVLLSENGDSDFQHDLMLLAQEKALQEIRDGRRWDARTSSYIEHFAVSGVLSMIRKWLADGCIDEPEHLAELMTRFLYEGIL